MDIQGIAVTVLFLAAVIYLGRMAINAFKRPTKGGCAKGCGCESTTH